MSLAAVAQAAGRLSPRHKMFANLYLSGMAPDAAYRTAFETSNDNSNLLLQQPRVRAYLAKVQDEAIAHVVVTQKILHGHAMRIARGEGQDVSPGLRLEAIKYLDERISQNRTIRIDGLTLKLDVDEQHVAALAYAALEAEAKGELGSDDARHLIESAALVQQIMHGRTIAKDLNGEAQPRLLPPQAAPPNGSAPPQGSGNGHSNGHGNGARTPLKAATKVTQHANGDVTLEVPSEPQPVRPKWLKTPEAIAQAAAARAAKKNEANGG